MTLYKKIHRLSHDKLVFSRRVRKLTECINALLPSPGSILDVGCGDGSISSEIQRLNPTCTFLGVDVVERSSCHIPYQIYDGKTIPFAPGSFDYVLLIDVLHHTKNLEALLAQAKQIARRAIIIKDHYCESLLDYYTLAFMDWVGNAPFDVPLPNNYKSLAQWQEIFSTCGLKILRSNESLSLYPFPFEMIFGRKLHFVSLLSV